MMFTITAVGYILLANVINTNLYVTQPTRLSMHCYNRLPQHVDRYFDDPNKRDVMEKQQDY